MRDEPTRQPRTPTAPLEALAPGDLAVELTHPPRLWVGRSGHPTGPFFSFGLQWEEIASGGAGVPGGGTVTSVATAAPLAGGPITGTGTITHANSGVTAGTFQGLTLNASGHVTAATNMNYALQSALTALAARVTALENAGPTLTAPVITSSNTASATVGQSFSYTMSATGNPTPTLSASGLPSWLTHSGHVVSGTPPVGSDVTGATFTVHASNSQGSPTMLVTVTIAPAAGAWTVTHSASVVSYVTHNIPLTSWTGWLPAHMAAFGSPPDYLYDPAFVPNAAAMPIKLFAKHTSDAAFVEVPFDGFGPHPTGMSNTVWEWGFDGTNIYITGSNSTGSPIQLELRRA